jgi:hypothetical protein
MAMFLEVTMIEFATVSREFHSLIARRRHLLTFLGSVFAATGIFLQNVLHGSLPPGLKSVEGHVFAFYAFMLMVPTLVIALRMARMHAGMVINGVLFARLMQDQTFTRPGDPRQAARHNWFGVSFLQFVLVSLLAAFSAGVLALALAYRLHVAVAAGAAVFVVWVAWYFKLHHQAAAFALHKSASDTTAPFDRAQWEDHVSTSLEEANLGLLTEIGFTGLMVFSVFEKLSGFGEIKSTSTDLTPDDVKQYGPLVYGIVILATCLFELMVYVRVRVAIGHFCLQLDPSDRPFRPLRLTDSLLGYFLLAFLFAVSLDLVLIMAVPALEGRPAALFAIDGAAFGLAVLAEQITLVMVGRRTTVDQRQAG